MGGKEIHEVKRKKTPKGNKITNVQPYQPSLLLLMKLTTNRELKT